MKTKQEELIAAIKSKLATTEQNAGFKEAGKYMTVGIVVDTDDPLQMGRLRVFCASLGDDPEKIHKLPWCTYVSPFAGSIDNTNFLREGQSTSGPLSYGFWAIPDLGAEVLVGCVDGDLRKRFYGGAFFPHQETNTLLSGRYHYDLNGAVDGPLSSDNQPVQPYYDNSMESFNNKNNSPEWKTRIVDYQTTKVSGVPNSDKENYKDQDRSELQDSEKLYKDRIGQQGYGFSGFDELPILSSKVFGFVTPGFHSITFDDRDYASKVKIKSAAGHSILLDDTNERIYIKTNKGNSYIELDSNGNGDLYFKRRLSVHAEDDINFSSDKTVRLYGKEGVYIYAGEENGLPDLNSNPNKGEVRIQSQNDMHVVSQKYHHLSFDDSLYEIGGKKCETVGKDYNLQVQENINFLTNAGDFNTTISGDYNIEVLKKFGAFSIDGMNLYTRGDLNQYTFAGKLNLGSQSDITVKTVSGGMSFQSVGANGSSSGAIRFKTPNSQINLDQNGGTISTSGSLAVQSGGNMSVQSNAPSNQNQPIPSSSVPDISCSLSAPLDVLGYDGADLCARVAYNAGFRGQSLVTAIAIASAESSYNPNNTGDVVLETDKWGPSCGFWQIRTLKDPTSYTGVDYKRNISYIYDPQYNANLAYELSNSGQNFGPWSTFMDQSYLKSTNINSAIDAVNRLCNPPTPSPTISGTPTSFSASYSTTGFESIMAQPSTNVDLYGATVSNGIKPSIHFTDTGIQLQSLDDIELITLNNNFSTKVFQNLIPQINNNTLQLDTLAYYSSIAISTIGNIIGSTIPFPIDTGQITSLVTIPSSFTGIAELVDGGSTLTLTSIPSNYFNYLDAHAEVTMNFENFDINGGTIIL